MIARRVVWLCLLALPLQASAAVSAVSAVSAGERAAVEAATAYLASGPQAIVARLSADSPIRHLPAATALEEIETRLGPPDGAKWELETVTPALQNKRAVFDISYPSGVDETVTFDLANENGTFTIRDIRIAALPSDRKPVFAAAAVTTAAAETAPKSDARAALLMLFAAIVGGGAAFVSSKHRGASLAMTGVAAVAVAGAIVLARDRIFAPVVTAAPVAKTGAADRYPSIAPLLPLRRAIASGVAELPDAGCVERRCADVALLWKAQIDVEQSKTDEAKQILGRFPSPSDIPLAEMLRGRIALLEGDAAGSALAYEHAVNLGPGRDSIWLETAQALMALGFDDRATKYLNRLTRIGSRSPAAYYSLASLAGSKGHDEEASKYLQQAWALQPIERSTLVSVPTFAAVLRRPEISTMIPMGAVEEGRFTSSDVSTQPIAMPANAVAQVCGSLLRIRAGEQVLEVPGGAAFAPPNTPVMDPAALDKEEEEQALRDFQQLAGAAHNAGAFTQPALRRRVTRTAEALAEHNRWGDLATLTEMLSPRSEHVPANLFFLRDKALERLNRRDEARALLEQLATSRVLTRKRDARALESLGEMFAAQDQFDAAIAMYDKAQAIRPNPMADDRVRQIEMNKRLATRFSQERTPHFEIRYPEDVSPTGAKQIGVILEAELKRLQTWVPIADVKPVTVNIVWWRDFRSTYTGNDFILGFYQGKITVPLAGVQQFVPPIVALLSHELCHALLAQATNDQTPSWFHEGLAQRIEMVDYHANAFNMYDDSKLLAMSVLEATIRQSGDPDMISEAYIESQTVIRYIEAKYGMKGIASMIAAFRDGATTEDAIRKVTGQSVAEFDTQLRAWGRSGARVFENPPPIRYDLDDSDTIRWADPKKGSGQ